MNSLKPEITLLPVLALFSLQAASQRNGYIRQSSNHLAVVRHTIEAVLTGYLQQNKRDRNDEYQHYHTQQQINQNAADSCSLCHCFTFGAFTLHCHSAAPPVQ